MNDDGAGAFASAPDQARPLLPASSAASFPPAPPGAPPPPPPPDPVPPRRSNRVRLLAGFAAALIAGAAIGVPIGLLTRGSAPAPAARVPSPGSSSAAAQASALYRQALAAMRSSAGVHYVADSTGGAVTQRIVGDAGASGGRQVITVTAPIGREQFTLILVSGTVYFQGNVPALEDQLGVSAANAPGLDGKWVSVSSQDGPYVVVAPGITVADQAPPLVPSSATPVSAAGGTRATRILGAVPAQQGAPAGTGHVDIADATHLPISSVSTLSVNGVASTSTATFSGWGTAPSVTAPTGAVAWSTLGASMPPGGYGSGGAGAAPSATPQL